ncbi:MAG: 30S ribosome-binding factor RbfA [Candidatus Eutrophobiaceae bacterium]
MPREFSRYRQMAKQVQHELATLLQQRFPVSDYGLFSVSGVDLSPDLKNAKVYITRLDTDSSTLSVDELLAVFSKDKGALRFALASRIHSRSVPQLRFIHDRAIERAARVDSLLASLHKPSEG